MNCRVVTFSRRALIGSAVGAAGALALPAWAQSGGPTACAAESPLPGRSPAVNRAIRDLVVANRILAHEGVMDAYGHVSVRHPENPDHFLIGISRSPSLINPDDIMEFRHDGTVVGNDPRQSYVERYIHGSIYRARSDLNAVAHAHSPEVLPFTVGSVPYRIVTHSAGVVGEKVPVWDIRTRFGDTNLLVDTDAMGRDLAATLAANNVVLMRGHGFAGAGRDLIELIRICIYLGVNAKVLLEALRLGEVTYLTPGEIGKVKNVESGGPGLQRAWQYWAERANCSNLVSP